ncbi:MAG TPA: hypothetical protein VL485_02825 [Ktedonobacteraceae bacterium]|nr:hypothetical protein [Ktedonobacteraceae bacterium]
MSPKKPVICVPPPTLSPFRRGRGCVFYHPTRPPPTPLPFHEPVPPSIETGGQTEPFLG